MAVSNEKVLTKSGSTRRARPLSKAFFIPTALVADDLNGPAADRTRLQLIKSFDTGG